VHGSSSDSEIFVLPKSTAQKSTLSSGSEIFVPSTSFRSRLTLTHKRRAYRRLAQKRSRKLAAALLVALLLVALLLLFAFLDVLLGVDWFLVVLPATLVVWLLAALFLVAAGTRAGAAGRGRRAAVSRAAAGTAA